MKTIGLGVGVAIGYLAGNAEARAKVLSMFKSIESTPRAQALEDKVSSTFTQLSARVTGDHDGDDSALSLPPSTSDADAPLRLSGA
jgi:hypothetical protein